MGRAADQAKGKAYVCDLTADQMREYRGTLTEPGKRQPLSRPLGRGEPRSVRADAGRRVPRRLAHAAGQDRHGLAEPQHARSGDVPHPARRRTIARATSGASIRCTTSRTASPIRSRASRTRSARWSSRTIGRCTTGSSRRCGIYHPQQIEFARLNLTYTRDEQAQAAASWSRRTTSAAGTIRACRRSAACAAAATRPKRSAPSASRSASPSSTASSTSHVLENALREDLNRRAPRVMAVLRPAQGGDRQLSRRAGRGAGRGQQSRRPRAGHAQGALLARVLYIEQDDFREDPPKKFFRLAPGREVRLRYGYFITCIRRRQGSARPARSSELHCTYDPATRGGNAPDGRKVQGDHPLGLGQARRRRRSAAVRSPVHEGRPRRRPGRADYRGEPEPEVARRR